MFGKNQRVQPSDTLARGKEALTKRFRVRFSFGVKLSRRIHGGIG